MAERDLDRSEAAGTDEARVPSPQPELPDAFAPGLALGAEGDPGLDGAGAEPGDAGDPYGPPDDLDTADAYGPAEEYGAADPYDPGSYGLGALGLVGDDYDTGDEHRPPDDEAPGQDPSLPLIQDSGGPPGQFGAPAPPGADSWLAEPGGPDAGPAEVREEQGSPAPLLPQPRPSRPRDPRPRHPGLDRGQYPHPRRRSRPTASPPTCSCPGGTKPRPAAGAAQSSR